MFKRYWRLGLVISMVLLLAVSVVPYVHPQSQEPFLIGVYGPMTGPAAESGSYIKNGAIMAVEEINATGGILGRQIKLVFGDTESKPSAAVSMMERLITHDKVNLVTGGLHSDVALATMDITAKYGIPQIMNTPVSGEITKKIAENPDKFKYVVKNGPSPATYAVAWPELLEYLENKGLIEPRNKTVVFIRERTSWGRSLEESISGGLEGKGWKTVDVETVEVDQSDYLSLLSKIKSFNPDVIQVLQTSVAAATSLLKQFTQSGISALYLATFVPSNPDYIKLAGPAANGVIWALNITILPTEKGQAFVANYKKRWGKEPAMTAALQYDLIHMIRIAYTIAGSFDKDKFMDAFLGLTYEGTTGIYAYNRDNHEIKAGPEFIPTIAYQIQNQKNVVIWPERYAEGSFISPPWIGK